MVDTIGDAIEKNAKGPKRMRGDEGEVEQHPLKEQMDADRFVTGKTGGATKTRGLRYNTFKPTGTV